jgi:hypothetical protein
VGTSDNDRDLLKLVKILELRRVIQNGNAELVLRQNLPQAQTELPRGARGNCNGQSGRGKYTFQSAPIVHWYHLPGAIDAQVAVNMGG